MVASTKNVLLIDLDDGRRSSRVRVLESAGYTVSVHNRFEVTEKLAQENRFDLVVLALHEGPELAALYGDRLAKRFPNLPVLLLVDGGVYVPKGTLGRSMEAGSASELLKNVAEMLAGSVNVREI